MSYPLDELFKVLVNNRLHDASVHIGKPDRHQRANHEQHSECDDVLDFSALPVGHDVSYEFEDALPELFVNVTLASFFGLAGLLGLETLGMLGGALVAVACAQENDEGHDLAI